MADQIKLSPQLIDSVVQAVRAADDRAQDPAVTLQYLAAIIGCVIGDQEDMPLADKHEFLDQLSAFAHHVLEDVDKSKQKAPPAQEAFGIWRPGSK